MVNVKEPKFFVVPGQSRISKQLGRYMGMVVYVLLYNIIMFHVYV